MKVSGMLSARARRLLSCVFVATLTSLQTFVSLTELSTTGYDDVPLPNNTVVLDEVARLLLPPDDAETYIQRFSGRNFSYYLYDLPDEFNWRSVARCIEQKYPNESSCDWGSSICTDSSPGSVFASRRFNRNGDLVLAKIFDEYHGPLRTADPKQADLFIVPFPSAAYCMCHSTRARCSRDVEDSRLESLFATLSHFNNKTAHLHLFTASVLYHIVHPFLQRNAPLLTTIGPTEGCRAQPHSACGHLVVPYANTNPENQPGRLQRKSLETRTYALSAFMTPEISGRRDDRLAFFTAINNSLSNQTLGARPVLIAKLGDRVIARGEATIQQSYRDSIFCPCLRGDEPPQKRFFDALLGGCIPVVLAHNKSSDPRFPSWFAPGTASLHRTYPFAKGSFAGWPNMGIGYQQMVVEIDGACGIPCMFPTLEDLLLNKPDVIRRKQSHIARWAQLLTYGMEQNGLQHPDAVSAILVHARHYVHSRFTVNITGLPPNYKPTR